MNNNPYLQYRHCEGLGDIIACTLHSKLISPITKLVTGKTEICHACDKRRRYLNFMFPINISKLFFKTPEEKIKDLEKYFVNNNQNSDIDEYISDSSLNKDYNATLPLNQKYKDSNIKEGYIIINNNEIEVEGFLYKTIIYKKI